MSDREEDDHQTPSATPPHSGDAQEAKENKLREKPKRGPKSRKMLSLLMEHKKSFQMREKAKKQHSAKTAKTAAENGIPKPPGEQQDRESTIPSGDVDQDRKKSEELSFSTLFSKDRKEDGQGRQRVLPLPRAKKKLQQEQRLGTPKRHRHARSRIPYPSAALLFPTGVNDIILRCGVERRSHRVPSVVRVIAAAICYELTSAAIHSTLGRNCRKIRATDVACAYRHKLRDRVII